MEGVVACGVKPSDKEAGKGDLEGIPQELHKCGMVGDHGDVGVPPWGAIGGVAHCLYLSPQGVQVKEEATLLLEDALACAEGLVIGLYGGPRAHIEGAEIKQYTNNDSVALSVALVLEAAVVGEANKGQVAMLG